MTWTDMQDRLRRVIGIFQENIFRLGTGEEVIKLSKDMFLTVSQAFNVYATSVVMEENQEGPPVLILNMVARIESRLDELILKCPFETQPHDPVNKSGVCKASSMEEVVKSIEKFLEDAKRINMEACKKIGGMYEN